MIERISGPTDIPALGATVRLVRKTRRDALVPEDISSDTDLIVIGTHVERLGSGEDELLIVWVWTGAMAGAQPYMDIANNKRLIQKMHEDFEADKGLPENVRFYDRRSLEVIGRVAS